MILYFLHLIGNLFLDLHILSKKKKCSFFKYQKCIVVVTVCVCVCVCSTIKTKTNLKFYFFGILKCSHLDEATCLRALTLLKNLFLIEILSFVTQT